MATFLISYHRLGPKEGGWADNKVDRGGETWKGIARNRNPDWPGWHLIDEVKRQPGFPENLNHLPELEEAVQALYREKYWPPMTDSLPQALADELFESGVNCGVINGIRFLQVAVNILNRNQKLYPDIDEDGKLGQETIGAVMACLNARGEKTLLRFMNHAQGNYYWSLMLRDPSQEEFAISWFNRVEV